MAIPAGTHAKAIVVVESAEGLQHVDVLWYTPAVVDEPVSAAAAAALAAAVATNVRTAYMGVLTPSCHYVGVEVTVTDGGFAYSYDLTNRGAGTSPASDELPDEMACVLRKYSGLPGARGRGRWYIPLVPEVFTDGPRLTDAGFVAYSTLATAMYAALSAEGHGTWNAAHLSIAATEFSPISLVTVNRLLGHQARRRPRVLL